jgi:hypothetical protein
MDTFDGTLIEHDILLRREAISTELCLDIINRFEADPAKEQGRSEGGLTSKKTSVDLDPFVIPSWDDLSQAIRELIAENWRAALSERRFKLALCQEATQLSATNPQIQRYRCGEGKFDWHLDAFAGDRRVLAGIAYLNDVDDGGETEFWGRVGIAPSAGSIVLFPPYWTHIHRGRVPLSSDKYVMTWFYEFG